MSRGPCVRTDGQNLTPESLQPTGGVFDPTTGLAQPLQQTCAVQRPLAVSGPLTDEGIAALAGSCRMIEPFIPHQVRDLQGQQVISYGLSSMGYDIRLADEYKIYTNINTTIVAPKNFDARSFVKYYGASCLIPPNSFALGRSMEYFRMPRHVMGVCLGKSTYARCGLVVNITPLEPGWEGYLTIEISNTTPLPAKIYSFEGIAQVVFLAASQPCRTSYQDRGGKYQHQIGVTLPKL